MSLINKSRTEFQPYRRKSNKTAFSSFFLGFFCLLLAVVFLYFRRYVIASAFLWASVICFTLGCFGVSVPDLGLYLLFPLGAVKNLVLFYTNGKPFEKFNR